MADLSDVENALVSTVGSVLFPGGQASSTPINSVLGVPGRVYRGWPNSGELDADLRAGVFHVTVYPRPGMERNTTRGLDDTVDLIVNAATWTLTASGQTITVGGQGANPYAQQNLTALVNGKAYVTPTTGSGDSAASLASALEALISTDVPGCSVSGGVITLPADVRIGGVFVGALGQTYREVKRQQRQFQVTAWCNDPLLRDKVVSQIDTALGGMTFLTLADGTGGRLIYAGTNVNDAPEKELLYRRDLFYTVEYATTLINPATQIGVVVAAVADANGTPIATFNV